MLTGPLSIPREPPRDHLVRVLVRGEDLVEGLFYLSIPEHERDPLDECRRLRGYGLLELEGAQPQFPGEAPVLLDKDATG